MAKSKGNSFSLLVLLFVLVGILVVVLSKRGVIAVDALSGGKKGQIFVLFIGNSFTFYHNMPELVSGIASREAKDIKLVSEMEAPAGVSLEWHYEQGAARTRIAEGHWHYVVLQEQSTGPLDDPTKMSHYLELFVKEIEAIDATPVLFLTWADLDRPTEQVKISEVYRGAALQTGALLAPVGEAFKLSLSEHSDLKLHDGDQHHSNLFGSYLAARVIYTLIANDYGIEQKKSGFLSFLDVSRPRGITSELDKLFIDVTDQLLE